MLLPRVDAKFCSPKCGTYYRRLGALPKELTSRARWVRRSGRKVPLMANGRVASSTDPETWTSYAKAKASIAGVGLGFVLNGDGIGCLDLDSCISDGRVEPWAREILDANPNTFVELSASGEGLHIWGLLESMPGRRIRDGRNLEIYSTGRYIAMGSRFNRSPLKLSPLVIA